MTLEELNIGEVFKHVSKFNKPEHSKIWEVIGDIRNNPTYRHRERPCQQQGTKKRVQKRCDSEVEIIKNPDNLQFAEEFGWLELARYM